MITNLLPLEATHSSLDLFEKAPLLVTFDYSFEQKIGPAYSPNGPNLEFEVVGDRNNFIDLQKIYLEKNTGYFRQVGMHCDMPRTQLYQMILVLSTTHSIPCFPTAL